MTFTRRSFLAATLAAPLLQAATPKLRITKLELIPVRASERTVWMIVKLSTDKGLTGLGEASDAFGYANTTKEQAAQMESELRKFFVAVNGKSPFEVEAYRQKAMAVARAGGLIPSTAFSAIEQAMWDLAGQALGVPVHALFGGKVRDTLPVYANINRATKNRVPAGFADTARRAVAEGFRAVKAAPFDGFPALTRPAAEIEAAATLGIACMAAIREAVGPEVDVMCDAHSFFSVPLAIEVAQKMEELRLGWYEEPVAPERTAETLQIHRSIRQKMSGGETLFAIEGFEALCREHAVDVIMPDVKHCGGLLELSHIAAMARSYGVLVAPHNPSGPVSTAAGVQMCAGLENFRYMELQWGETSWRRDLMSPVEKFEGGTIRVPDRPGFGIQLNEKLAKSHPV